MDILSNMTIRQFLNNINGVTNSPFIFTDVETTGLKGYKIEQLTQISAISTNFDYANVIFTENNVFDRKIKLTKYTENRIHEEKDIDMKYKVSDILEMNHYYEGNYKYYNEDKTLNIFHKWLSDYVNPLLIIQNAKFDLDMLNGRYNNKFGFEVLDTKIVLQMFFIPMLQKLSETDDDYKNMISIIGTSDRDYGLISSSMSNIGPAIGLNMNMYHNSLNDCIITMRMLEYVIKLLKANIDLDIDKYQKERLSKKIKV